MAWAGWTMPGPCLDYWTLHGLLQAMSKFVSAVGPNHALAASAHRHVSSSALCGVPGGPSMPAGAQKMPLRCRRSLSASAVGANRPLPQALHFVEILVGPKCAELTVENPQQYYFDREL